MLCYAILYAYLPPDFRTLLSLSLHSLLPRRTIFSRSETNIEKAWPPVYFTPLFLSFLRCSSFLRKKDEYALFTWHKHVLGFQPSFLVRLYTHTHIYIYVRTYVYMCSIQASYWLCCPTPDGLVILTVPLPERILRSPFSTQVLILLNSSLYSKQPQPPHWCCNVRSCRDDLLSEGRLSLYVNRIQAE